MRSAGNRDQVVVNCSMPSPMGLVGHACRRYWVHLLEPATSRRRTGWGLSRAQLTAPRMQSRLCVAAVRAWRAEACKDCHTKQTMLASAVQHIISNMFAIAAQQRLGRGAALTKVAFHSTLTKFVLVMVLKDKALNLCLVTSGEVHFPSSGACTQAQHSFNAPI
ncbi:hypothetical protein BKA81DRAFT_128362 [Phyllosticta paracitricarpa]